jgi:hypothetical protein
MLWLEKFLGMENIATMRQSEVSANNLDGWEYFQKSYLSFVFLPIAKMQINCKS